MEKMLFNLNTEAYNRFFLSYIGARQLKVNATKSFLATQVVQNSMNNEQLIMYDCNRKGYTGCDLYNLGVSSIKRFFGYILNLSDDGLRQLVTSLNVLKNDYDRKSILCKLMKVTSSKYMSNHLMDDTRGGKKCLINLSASDYESLVNVITYVDESATPPYKPEYNFDKYIKLLFDKIDLVVSFDILNKCDVFEE